MSVDSDSVMDLEVVLTVVAVLGGVGLLESLILGDRNTVAIFWIGLAILYMLYRLLVAVEDLAYDS